jgi:hypothetical protein
LAEKEAGLYMGGKRVKAKKPSWTYINKNSLESKKAVTSLFPIYMMGEKVKGCNPYIRI